MVLTAVITGASAGIGKAIAQKFAESGYKLALISRRKEKLEEVRLELKSAEVHTFALDISSRDAVAATCSSIEKAFGHVDILVNNAGVAFGLDRAQDADVKEWEKCIQTNINGLLYCTHAILPGMVKRNKGHIINLGSVAGSYPYPGGNVYCGTKAFVHQFSLSLRADLLGTEVRVTCIEPGLLGKTEFSTMRFRGDAERANNIYKGTDPLLPEDVAQVVDFCVKLPSHVNINTIEMMPTTQAFGPLPVHKNP